MGKNFLLTVLLCLLIINITNGQEPLSFFPHNVGDRWEYVDLNTGQVTIKQITRDSVGEDGSHNLFYNNSLQVNHRIDTAYNVFWLPQEPFINYLRYKLGADSCDSWENINFGSIRWAWLAYIESTYVFSQPTISKIFRYGPGNPCDEGALEEDWLASGFGLVYTWREPNDIIYLRGCVINGDTFGIVTSVEPIVNKIPSDFSLKQNYPNPFNPSTTIEFILPQEAEINLSIFDILGRQVAVLYEGLKGVGVYKYKWKAQGISSGIYFCRLSANGNIQTIKMFLTK